MPNISRLHQQNETLAESQKLTKSDKWTLNKIIVKCHKTRASKIELN